MTRIKEDETTKQQIAMVKEKEKTGMKYKP